MDVLFMVVLFNEFIAIYLLQWDSFDSLYINTFILSWKGLLQINSIHQSIIDIYTIFIKTLDTLIKNNGNFMTTYFFLILWNYRYLLNQKRISCIECNSNCFNNFFCKFYRFFNSNLMSRNWSFYPITLRFNQGK